MRENKRLSFGRILFIFPSVPYIPLAEYVLYQIGDPQAELCRSQ